MEHVAPASSSATHAVDWPMSHAWYVTARLTVGNLLGVYFRLHYAGHDNIPTTGPCVLVSNHQSVLDPWILAKGMAREMGFMAKVELFRHPVASFLLHRIGVFPVHRGEGDAKAIKTALHILREGYILGMFPEGTRSADGEVQSMRAGAIRLAEKVDAPILPCCIVGTNALWPRGQFLPKPGPVWVRFGHPYRLSERYGRRLTEANRIDAMNDMRDRIAALMRGDAT